MREQPSAAVFVFAVDVVFHLRPNDFPKLEMWLFTPKAAISHPHPPPHTHTHTHTHIYIYLDPVYVCCTKLLHTCPTLSNPIDYSPPVSSAPGTSATWKAHIHMILYGICLCLTYLVASSFLLFFFLSKPQVEPNTSFLKTGSVTRNEFNRKIVPNSQPLRIGG